MAAVKLKLPVVLGLLAAVVLAGAGGWAHQALEERPPQASQLFSGSQVRAAPGEKPAAGHAAGGLPHLDRCTGDPLPPGC